LSNRTQIAVELIENDNPLHFSVVVSEGGSQTQHKVTMDRAVAQQLSAGKTSPEGLVQAAFLFLLEREPKESILGSFDITLIAKYFPDFPHKVADYL
jgi:hypothetical protein